MYINVRRERHAQRKHVPDIYTLCVKNVDNIFIFYYNIMFGLIYVIQCTFTLIHSYLSA